MFAGILHSGQYWRNSTPSVKTPSDFSRAKILSLLAWDMNHMPLTETKIAIMLQAHSASWGKGTKTFLALDYSMKLYK